MITGLTIKNCIPLLEKGVSSIELDTRDMWNILLGRNGYGKTTLLRMVTPMPPDNADFGPEGYKEWRYADDRGTFVLKSKTGKNNHHEFIHNGKNLNDGNTLMVQRDLVKIHFGVTQSLIDVLTGLDVADLFTTMSVARRKDFLMTVNPNDTTYALKVFDKLRGNYNAIKGGLKTQRQRLVVEEGRMSQLAGLDPATLRTEINHLDSQIKDALVLHGKLSNVKNQELKPLVTEVKDLLSRLIGNDHQIKMTSGQYEYKLDVLLQRLAHRGERSTKLAAVHSEITQQLQGMDASTQSLDGYKKRLERIEDSLEKLKVNIEIVEGFFTEHPFFQENELYRDEAIVLNGSELVEQLRMVERARDPAATSEKFKQAEEKAVQYKNEIANLENDITQINHQLKHFANADTVTCPDCEVKFKIGFERFKPQELENVREDRVRARDDLKEKLQRCMDYVEANQEWYSSMAGYMRYIRRSEHFEILSKLTQHYNVGKADDTVLVEALRRAVQLDRSLKQFAHLEEEYAQVNVQIKFLESSDVNALFMRAEDVEREMAIVQREIGYVRTEIRKVQNYLSIIQEDGFRRARLSDLVEQIMDGLEQNGMHHIKVGVQTAIDDLSPRKDQLISNLIRGESLRSVIESIKDNIADLEKREKHTQLLLDGLSPVKGLIGYLMNDFLKAVIANMNSILGQIWTTRFRILNCSNSKNEDDVELNYVFPAMTGTSNKPNKDISKCSGGEKEMINFVFRLVILRYLGPKCGIPLFMDEVGVALDTLHKGTFHGWMGEQFRTDMLPKIFMISHNYSQFGSVDANFIALNTEGLHVPSKINQKSIIR